MAPAPIMSPALSDNSAHKAIQDKCATRSIRFARQILVLPEAAAHVLVATPASGLFVRQPPLKFLTRRRANTAKKIMGIIPGQPLYATVRNFSHKAQH